MESFTLKIEISLSNGEYNFALNEIPKELKKKYLFNFTKENINYLGNKILESDGTAKSRFLSGNKVNWNIEISKAKVTSRRFKRYLSNLILDRDFDNSLLDFQKDGVKWLLSGNSRLLADDMGLGKTLQVIKALETLFFKSRASKALIFCPNALQKNWVSEFNKWTNIVSILNLCSFSKSNVETALNNFSIIIAPYSRSNVILQALKETNIGIDVIVADEAHKLRNEGTSINTSLRKFKSARKWMLTGTPLERDNKDIINILNLLDSKLNLSHNEVENIILKNKLASVSLRREKKQVLKELPKITKQTHMLDMTPEQNTSYRTMRESIINKPLKERIGLISKLSIAACAGEGDHSNKADFTLRLLKDICVKNEKCLVFSNYNNILNIVEKVITNFGIKSLLYTGQINLETRNKNLELFKNNNNYPVLLLNSRIGSEGLTLTEANNVIFLNEWWNPSSNRQAEDRINRIGQNKPLNMHILRSKNTIDVHIGRILEKKKSLEHEFIDYLVQNI